MDVGERYIDPNSWFFMPKKTFNYPIRPIKEYPDGKLPAALLFAPTNYVENGS
jgi:hypothetical protein